MEQPSALMQDWIRIGHRFRHIRWPKSATGMSRPDFFVMNMIFHHQMRYPDTPGIYASTIAKRAQVSRAAVSRQLQQMENRGWILRSTDPNSKRSVFVKLTDAGIAVVQQQYASEEQLFQRAFARVGEQRVAEAFGVLDEMMAALETESKALPDSSQTIQGKGVCK